MVAYFSKEMIVAQDRNQSDSQGGGQGGSNNQGNSNQSGQGGGNNQGSQSGGSSGSSDDFNSNDAKVGDWRPGQVGEVQDEDYDGRLKENRMEGKTLGTTDHAKDAPHEIDKDQGQSGGSSGSTGNNQGSGDQGSSSSGSGNQGSGSSGGNQGGSNKS